MYSSFFQPGDIVITAIPSRDINGDIPAGTKLELSGFQRLQDGEEIWSAWGLGRLVATSSAVFSRIVIPVESVDTLPVSP